MHVKKQQLELNIEQWTVSKMGNEQAKALFCHLAYLNYMQSTSYQLDEVEVVINKAEVMVFWYFLAFSMITQMLAI